MQVVNRAILINKLRNFSMFSTLRKVKCILIIYELYWANGIL